MGTVLQPLRSGWAPLWSISLDHQHLLIGHEVQQAIVFSRKEIWGFEDKVSAIDFWLKGLDKLQAGSLVMLAEQKSFSLLRYESWALWAHEHHLGCEYGLWPSILASYRMLMQEQRLLWGLCLDSLAEVDLMSRQKKG